MAFITSSFSRISFPGRILSGYRHGHEVNICILFVLVDISLSYKKRGGGEQGFDNFYLLYF